MLVRRTVSLFAFALLALGALAGCTQPAAIVDSAWPVANSEATISAPPGIFRYPLSGLTVPDGARVATVPLCVKVHDGSVAPTGVNAADVVYETADSGSGTELACLFSSHVPKLVGPLGQAGMPDLWIVPQYRSMLFSAGATASIAASMKKWPAASDASLGSQADPTDVYSHGSLLGPAAAEYAARFASAVTSAGPARLAFATGDDATSSPIMRVTVPFLATRNVMWTYDGASGRYVRAVDGKPESDAASHELISARNVVVMWVRYAAIDADLAGGGGFDVTLGGSGQVSVFRDGERFDGRWKADANTAPRFTAEDGSAVRLAPGNTWVEAIPLSANITLK